MKISAAMITAISVFVAGCVAATNPKSTDTPPGAKQVSLPEGAIPSAGAHKNQQELKAGKVTAPSADEQSRHLETYVRSLPLEKREVILEGIRRHHTRHDEVKGFIRFEPVRRLSGPYARSSHIGLIGTLQPGKANAWAKIHYHNDVWVFAKGLRILTDDEIHELPDLKFRRDNYGGKVWETAVLDLSKSRNRDLIERIVSSKEAIIRFQGEKYYSDLPVTARMREDMEAMLKAIDAINAEEEVQANLSDPSPPPPVQPKGETGS